MSKSIELYNCIPKLNKECKKTNCYLVGGNCYQTIKEEYSLNGLLKEIERLNDIITKLLKEIEKLKKELTLEKQVKKEAREHLKESINDFLKDDRDIDGTLYVMCYETIRERYLKPVLEILDKVGETDESKRDV